MGSTALLSHPHLCCTRRPNPIRNFYRTPRNTNISYLNLESNSSKRASRKSLQRCSALEEEEAIKVQKKQEEQKSGGVGAALEERPGRSRDGRRGAGRAASGRLWRPAASGGRATSGGGQRCRVHAAGCGDGGRRVQAGDNLEEDGSKSFQQEESQSAVYNFLYPSQDLLPDDEEMSLFDHLEELRQRIFVSVLAVGAAIVGCFAFSKDLIILLEAPVSSQGVRFLQLSPGEFFFTTLKVSGYCGLLLASPIILYEIIAFVLPGLTREERRFLGPIVLGSSVLFYAGIAFSYIVLAPAALNFFVNYAEGAVESLWSIDQYFEFVLILLFSTGLSFQVPVIQLLLGQTGLVSSEQMLSIWRYVVVGAVVAAAILTPSTDPFTQVLLAGPLLGLYLGGAWTVKLMGR